MSVLHELNSVKNCVFHCLKTEFYWLDNIILLDSIDSGVTGLYTNPVEPVNTRTELYTAVLHRARYAVELEINHRRKEDKLRRGYSDCHTMRQHSAIRELKYPIEFCCCLPLASFKFVALRKAGMTLEQIRLSGIAPSVSETVGSKYEAWKAWYPNRLIISESDPRLRKFNNLLTRVLVLSLDGWQPWLISRYLQIETRAVSDCLYKLRSHQWLSVPLRLARLPLQPFK